MKQVSIWGQVKRTFICFPSLWEAIRDEAHQLNDDMARLFLTGIQDYARFGVDISDYLETFPALKGKTGYFFNEIEKIK